VEEELNRGSTEAFPQGVLPSGDWTICCRAGHGCNLRISPASIGVPFRNSYNLESPREVKHGDRLSGRSKHGGLTVEIHASTDAWTMEPAE
jgi:hypothetical protein